MIPATLTQMIVPCEAKRNPDEIGPEHFVRINTNNLTNCSTTIIVPCVALFIVLFATELVEVSASFWHSLLIRK